MILPKQSLLPNTSLQNIRSDLHVDLDFTRFLGRGVIMRRWRRKTPRHNLVGRIHRTYYPVSYNPGCKTKSVTRRDGLETSRITTSIIYVGQRLWKNMVLYRHVCIVFWPNLPIEILTFLKRCYWFVGQEYNKYVMMKDLISS